MSADSRLKQHDGGSHRSRSRNEPAEDIKQMKMSTDEPFEKASFALSGALAKDNKTGNKVFKNERGDTEASKYSEPADACAPCESWRIFVFDGDNCIETLYLHRKSYYILGREDSLSDIVLAHPSCSKEHAALQYRKKKGGIPALYLIDLESTNGTLLNGEKMIPAHFVEIKDGDIVNFGQNSVDYIMKCGSAKKATTT